MFVNFSLLKNFHSNKLFIKCSIGPRVNHRRNHTVTPKYFSLNARYPLASLLKCYKSSVFKRCKIKDFEILRRNFNTGSRNYNRPNNPKNDGWKRFSITDVILYAALISFILSFNRRSSEFPDVFISWEEFKTEFLAKGEVIGLRINVPQPVVRVFVYEDSVIKNKKAHREYILNVPDVALFEEKLREAEEELGIAPADRIPVEYKVDTDVPILLMLLLSIFVPLAIYLGLKTKKVVGDSFLFRLSRYNIIDPLAGEGKGVKFSDVAGLKEAKTEIIDFVDYLKRPDIYRKLGAKVPKGALLLGPPGCGKTLLAKAVATEANVPFLSINGSEFIEIIGGLGAARVRDLFKAAKKRIPCIIYIDEIDAIGKKRESAGLTTGEAEQTLNQLLVEMDGVVSNEGIVLLASTNRADVLDKALLRPGRFDRHITIDLPTFLERQEIFEHHLKSIHLENKPEVYSKRMAYLTPGFSGADIANVCNEAALHAARLQKKIVQADDLEYAVERVVGGTEKRTSARTPEEKKMFAYYEAGRALVGWLSKYGEALLKITIVARTDTPAGWTHFAPSEKFLYSVEDLRGKMCMGLGGRVALSIFFNRVTTAGQKDLDKVTQLAYAQVRRFGMNKTIGLLSFDISGSQKTLKKPYSKVLGSLFDQEARRLVAETYKETEKLILDNKDKLIKLAEELLVKETLNYDDVVRLIGPPAFEGKVFVEPLEFSHSLDHAVRQGSENSISSKDS